MQNDKKRPATNTITDRNYQLKFKDGSIEQLPLLPLEEIADDRQNVASSPQFHKNSRDSINITSKKYKIIPQFPED